MPIDPSWTPHKENGLFQTWKPRILKVAGKQMFSGSVYVNPPFSFGPTYELSILKAHLANHIWGTRVIILLPTRDFEALDPQLKLKCCIGDRFTCKTIGKRKFKGYSGLSPFEVSLLIWL